MPDHAGPSLTIESPTANATLNGHVVAISGSVIEEGAGGSTVEVSSDGTTFHALSMTEDRFSGATELPDLDGAPATLTFRAADRLGNRSERVVAFTVDNVAPQVGITSPAAGGACPSDQTLPCIGAVANASSSPTISGVVADSGGLDSANGLIATLRKDATIVAGPVAITPGAGGAFSYAWSPPANEPGATYTIELVAKDAAGNTSAPALRDVWVDTVAPTVASSVNGDRHVVRSGVLVTFSEPMDRQSVHTGAVWSGGAAPAAFYTDVTDSLAATVGGAADLVAYTQYTLTLGANVKDRAGNGMAPASIAFLTELVAPPLPTTLVSYGIGTPRSPRVAVDSDGKPLVAWADPTGGVHLAAWDGRGAFVDSIIPSANIPGLTAGVPTALEVDSVATGTEPLQVTAHLLLLSTGDTDTADAYYLQTSEPTATSPVWTGLSSGSPADKLNALGKVSTRFSPSFVPKAACSGTGIFRICSSVRSALLADLTESGVGIFLRVPAGTAWDPRNLLLELQDPSGTLNGTAVVAGGALSIVNAGGASSLAPDRGLQAVGTFQHVPRTLLAPSGSAYLARVTDQLLFDPMSGMPVFLSRQIRLRCSNAPLTSGAWSAERLLYEVSSRTSFEVALASSIGTVGIALSDGSSTRFATIENDPGCTTGSEIPTPGFRLVTEASSPSLALGPDGTTLWSAYVKGRQVVIAKP